MFYSRKRKFAVYKDVLDNGEEDFVLLCVEQAVLGMPLTSQTIC